MITLDQFETMLRAGGYETLPECRPAHALPRGFRAWWRFYVSGVFGTILSREAADLRRDHTQRAFSAMSFRIIRSVESTGATVSVEGTANLSQGGAEPCVFVANHSSLLETFHLPCILGTFGPLTIVAKRSLSKYPLFGKCLKAVYPILLERKSARHDLAETLAQGKRHLENGRSVLLFPQGTRAAIFDPRKFNSLGAKLAREAGVPLVPIACKTDFAVPGRLVKDIGPIDPSKPVRYAIGPVLAPSLPQSELQKACTDFISQTLERWESRNGQ